MPIYCDCARIADLSPNARRLTQDRQAVKTLWKHSLKVRLQFIPRSVRAATKQSRHMSRVLVLRLLQVIGSIGIGPRVCPRRDVVSGWQYRDGLCFLAAPRSEKIGEHGRRKRRHVDDECT